MPLQAQVGTYRVKELDDDEIDFLRKNKTFKKMVKAGEVAIEGNKELWARDIRAKRKVERLI